MDFLQVWTVTSLWKASRGRVSCVFAAFAHSRGFPLRPDTCGQRADADLGGAVFCALASPRASEVVARGGAVLWLVARTEHLLLAA